MNKMNSIFLVIAMLYVLRIPTINSLPAKSTWPEKCSGSSYCPFKPQDYPQQEIDQLLKDVFLDLEANNGMMQNRSSSEEKDVGDCRTYKLFKPFYMILDEDDNARYVVQSQNFSYIIQIEECRNPGKVTNTRYLDDSLVQQEEVYCFETRPKLMLPVLSLDRKTLESVAPKGGLSVSCSAKKMRPV